MLLPLYVACLSVVHVDAFEQKTRRTTVQVEKQLTLRMMCRMPSVYAQEERNRKHTHACTNAMKVGGVAKLGFRMLCRLLSRYLPFHLRRVL